MSYMDPGTSPFHAGRRARTARGAAARMGIVLAFAVSAACRSTDAPPAPGEGRPFRIVCSFYPVYLFTLNVAGDVAGVEIDLLMPASAGCPHDYDLSTRDVRRIADADVLVVLGSIDAAVVEQASRIGARAAVVRATGVAQSDSAREHGTATRASASADHADEPDHVHDHTCAHDHGPTAVNDHAWVSPRLAMNHVRAIADGLARADPRRAANYAAGAEAYRARLDVLQRETAALRGQVQGRRIAAVHDVFQYLADDLGLEVAVTLRAADGDDPSARGLISLVERIRRERVAAVFSEPAYPAQLAQRVADESGIPCRPLDPVSTGPANPPRDYYERVMRQNLTTLREVLAP